MIRILAFVSFAAGVGCGPCVSSGVDTADHGRLSVREAVGGEEVDDVVMDRNMVTGWHASGSDPESLVVSANEGMILPSDINLGLRAAPDRSFPLGLQVVAGFADGGTEEVAAWDEEELGTHGFFGWSDGFWLSHAFADPVPLAFVRLTVTGGARLEIGEVEIVETAGCSGSDD